MNRAQLALMFIERLIALATILQAIESISFQSVFKKEGIWNWQTLKDDFLNAPAPVQGLLSFLFKDSVFLIIPWIQLITGIILLISPSALVISLLFFSTLALSIRFRGAFNGGSDSMTLIILGTLMIAKFFEPSLIVSQAALFYIALQIVLSYFLSGVGKVRKSSWRSGYALSEILRSSYYSVPEAVQKRAASRLWRPISRLILLFELAFPLSLLNPSLAFIFLCMAFLFHLANIYLFGLNRFLFAWLAGYPAVIYTSQMFM